MLGHLSILILTYFGTKGRAEISFSKNDLNIEKLKHLARKYSDLPLVNGLHAFTDMLQVTGVIFVISAVFESVTTGLYGLTMRILQAPLTMIGTSFSIVFYKEASEKVANNQKITKLLRTTILTLAAISFPVFLVIMIIGPDLFAFVFGESWRDAGVYARILSPYLFMNFISSPVSHLPVILNKQREFFLLSLVGNILVLAGILIGAFVYSDFQIGLIIVSISQVLYTGFVLYYFYSISRNYND
ncbi:MAG: oligosaccharide flippase family protein [Bacteroidetes bacterium]|nr:oligosaccharide flippase family protein [Bacteroidota bacterium]